MTILSYFKHLGLWEIKTRPPPKATGKTQEYHLDDSTSQLPEFTRRMYGGSDKWPYVDPEYPEAYSFDLEALDRPA